MDAQALKEPLLGPSQRDGKLRERKEYESSHMQTKQFCLNMLLKVSV